MSLGNPMWMSSIGWEKKSVMNHNMWVSVSKCECVLITAIIVRNEKKNQIFQSSEYTWSDSTLIVPN